MSTCMLQRPRLGCRQHIHRKGLGSFERCKYLLTVQGVAGRSVPGCAAGPPGAWSVAHGCAARDAAGHCRCHVLTAGCFNGTRGLPCAWQHLGSHTRRPYHQWMKAQYCSTPWMLVRLLTDADRCVLQRHNSRPWLAETGTCYVLCDEKQPSTGADGSIKLWALEDHLPRHQNAVPKRSGVPDQERHADDAGGICGNQLEMLTLQHKVMPQPAADALGELLKKVKGACHGILTQGHRYRSVHRTGWVQEVLTCRAAPSGARCSASKGQKGEEDWVCAMALASPDTLYVGTHKGRLQRVQLPGPGSASRQEEWQQLWHSPRAQPLSCLAVSLLREAACVQTILSMFASLEPGVDLLLNRLVGCAGACRPFRAEQRTRWGHRHLGGWGADWVGAPCGCRSHAARLHALCRWFSLSPA